MLVVQGPVTLVVDSLDVTDGAELRIDTTLGSVTIYCKDRLQLAAGTRLSSVGEDPKSCALVLDELDTPALLQSTGEYHGLLYAPRDEIILPATLRLFGAVAAQRLTLDDNARASFDVALTRSGWGADTVPRIVSWRIIDLPNVPLVRKRVDPRAALALAGITPTPSYDAHKEQVMAADYKDGVLDATYLGLPSAFTWGSVSTISSFDWIDPDTGLPLVGSKDPGAILVLK